MSGPPPEPEAPVPLGLRLVMAGLSLSLAGVLAEGMIRVLDGGALAHLRLFAQQEGRIVLRPNAGERVRRVDGQRFVVATDGAGTRVDPGGTRPEGGWLVVGDSQVLGMGVDHAETFAATMINAGVPGHGVFDALDQAEELIPQVSPRGVLVVVNQANDWEEGTRLATERYAVVGGWLLDSGAAARPSALFWGSPLSRSHLLYLSTMLLRVGGPGSGSTQAHTPEWMAEPGSQAELSKAFAAGIQALAAAHPTLPVVACFLPVDVATSEARGPRSAFGPRLGETRPWEDTTLRDQLAAALPGQLLIDLSPHLRDRPEAFIDRDYHLSTVGHGIVAGVLRTELP